MEPRRPLLRHGRAGAQGRSRPGGQRSRSPSRRATRASSARSPRGADGGKRLAEAVRAFEALEELLGRIMSYAGLLHAGDTSDPMRSKFYGDVQEKITAASAHLLFFALELNRIDDAVLDAAMERSGARPLPAVDRGHPQGEALPARGPGRAALPREVGDRRAAPGTGSSTRR